MREVSDLFAAAVKKCISLPKHCAVYTAHKCSKLELHFKAISKFIPLPPRWRANGKDRVKTG